VIGSTYCLSNLVFGRGEQICRGWTENLHHIVQVLVKLTSSDSL
jgi:hypothetical protein